MKIDKAAYVNSLEVPELPLHTNEIGFKSLSRSSLRAGIALA
jgi:hypothetical protein